MKKLNFLKTVLSFAFAMLLGVSVFAQNPPAPYGLYDANRLVPTNVDYVTLQADGSTSMGYYALPDPVYHPAYVASGTLTLGFVWDWSILPAMTITKPGSANYAEIAYTATGSYVVNVAEHAPATMGGCVDASPTVMNVTVVAPPTGTISIAPGGAWQQITLNASYQICGTQGAQTVTIAFNEAVPNTLGSYAFQITETIELLDGAGGVLSVSQPEAVIQDFPTASKLKTGNLGTLTAAAFTTVTPAFTFTFSSDALAILQNAGLDARTRYTYRVTRSGDATEDNFFSNISQKSDYLGALNYYDFTNQTVAFIVNPTPATGPIFYVPNSFNY